MTSIKPIQLAFLAMAPALALGTLDIAVNAFFIKRLGLEEKKLRWLEGGSFITKALGSLLISGMGGYAIRRLQLNPGLQALPSIWVTVNVVVYVSYKFIKTINNFKAIDNLKFKVTPAVMNFDSNGSTLAVWDVISKKINIGYECYFDYQNPEKFNINEQFNKWMNCNRELLNNLKELDLTLVLLQSLPSQIGQLSNLEILRLGHVRLENFPPFLNSLSKLKKLDLSSTSFKNLHQLPQYPNLERLDLTFNGITEIPEATHLPATLKNLNISFNQLTTLPDSLLRLPRTCWVEASRNSFSPETVRDLQNRLQNIRQENPLLGPRLSTSVDDWINQTLEIALGESFENRMAGLRASLLEVARGRFRKTETSLEDSILFWLKEFQQELPQLCQNKVDRLPGREGEESVCLVFYSSLFAHDKKEVLSDFLERLKRTKDYLSGGNSKVKLIHRVFQMLEEASLNEQFRTELFPILEGACETCGDLVTLVFAKDIESRIHLSRAGEKNDGELAKLVVGLKRMALLEERANYHVETLGLVDPVEVELFLYCQLREPLELPLSTEGMLYPKIAGISSEILQADAALVLDKSRSPEDVCTILAANEVWQERIKKNHQEAFNQQEKTFSAEMEALSENDSMGSHARVEAMNSLKSKRDNATQQFIEERTKTWVLASSSV